MTSAERPLDPYRLRNANDLPGQTLDGERTLCLPLFDAAAAVVGLAGLANSSGGHLLIGAKLDASGATVEAVPGVKAAATEARLRDLAARLEPPVDDLLQIRRLPAQPGHDLIVATVRRSQRPPHIDPASGLIYQSGLNGIEPVRSRAALDALYTRGKAERERADRLIEGMIERLMLAHYAFYGIGVLASLQQPTAEPYLWAREDLAGFAAHDDPFMAEWDFKPEQVKVRPGEAELRSEREVCGLARVARAGCVAVGETRRRPPGDVLGTPADLAKRIEVMVDTACRLLSHAGPRRIVPRLFCEGLRSMRLITSRQPYDESAPAELDMLQAPGPTGDATDPEYRRALAGQFTRQLCHVFRVDFPTSKLDSVPAGAGDQDAAAPAPRSTGDGAGA